MPALKLRINQERQLRSVNIWIYMVFKISVDEVVSRTQQLFLGAWKKWLYSLTNVVLHIIYEDNKKKVWKA